MYKSASDVYLPSRPPVSKVMISFVLLHRQMIDFFRAWCFLLLLFFFSSPLLLVVQGVVQLTTLASGDGWGLFCWIACIDASPQPLSLLANASFGLEHVNGALSRAVPVISKSFSRYFDAWWRMLHWQGLVWWCSREKHSLHTLTGLYNCSLGRGVECSEQSAQKILPQHLQPVPNKLLYISSSRPFLFHSTLSREIFPSWTIFYSIVIINSKNSSSTRSAGQFNFSTCSDACAFQARILCYNPYIDWQHDPVPTALELDPIPRQPPTTCPRGRTRRDHRRYLRSPAENPENQTYSLFIISIYHSWKKSLTYQNGLIKSIVSRVSTRNSDTLEKNHFY